MVKSRKSDSFYFTKEAKTAFKKVKEYFKLAPIFRLYNSKLPIRLETDTSEFAVKLLFYSYSQLKIISKKNNIRLYFGRGN
jgi:hypothetical protein